MLSATADTNIYISALNFERGNPREFLRLAAAGGFSLAISDAILQEIGKVLRREPFGWPEDEIEKAQGRLARITRHVTPERQIDAVKPDPSDNRIIECAVAAKSDYLVSGDKHLLRLGTFEGIPIIKVADFLQTARVRAEGVNFELAMRV